MAYAEDVRVTGTLGKLNDAVGINYPTMATTTFQLVGSPTMTVTFEANNDEGASPTFVPIPAVNVATGASSTTATAAGLYRIEASGIRVLRVRCSNYTSGSFAVTGNGSVAATTDGTASTGSSGTTTANQGTPNAAGTASWPVQGAAAAGAAVAGNPVLMGVSDGTNVQTLKQSPVTTSNGSNVGLGYSSVGLVSGAGTAEPWQSVAGLTDAMGHWIGTVAPYGYNGLSWDRVRNNGDVTLLASGSRNTTQTSADIVTYNAHSIIVTLDMTVVGTGSVTLSINYKDPASGKYIPLLTGAAVTTNSTNMYTINPNIPAVANVSAQKDIGRVIQIVVTANNTNSATFSVGYTLMS